MSTITVPSPKRSFSSLVDRVGAYLENHTDIVIGGVLLLMLLAIASPFLIVTGSGLLVSQNQLNQSAHEVVATANNYKSPASAREIRRDEALAALYVGSNYSPIGVVSSRVTNSRGLFTVALRGSSHQDCLAYSGDSRLWSYTSGACHY